VQLIEEKLKITSSTKSSVLRQQNTSTKDSITKANVSRVAKQKNVVRKFAFATRMGVKPNKAI